ncbi:MAG TPA: NAD-dependent epimerase/dehydratase family protein, partial [Ignavibacteriales bacterium]|nr:NAD-dependent epimerase/dehydratase family protein [Ignavibacteriales bacterium]
FHFGLKQFDGSPKLLYRTWIKEGIAGIKNLAEYGGGAQSRDSEVKSSKPKFNIAGGFKSKIGKEHVLITGGAGFIGCNLAERLLSEGKRVMIYDNLSRAGVEENLLWLRERHSDNLLIRVADVRNQYALKEAAANAESVFHFAAQVAVTTSIENPVNDFEINVNGTLNVLEALRTLNKKIPFVYTSTNKVYGALSGINFENDGTKYYPLNETFRSYGISENQPLDFHSPYGCSKGAADQYVKDYARIYGIPTVVFRMSCIYGRRQFGTEDQGWVAHFIIRILNGEPVTIYGDGKQVRDILFIDDLVNAFSLALNNIDKVSGKSFNIGGGPGNSISVMEALNIIQELNDGYLPPVSFSSWRQGDQVYYVSDTREYYKAAGWKPNISAEEGIAALYKWLYENRANVMDIIKLKKAAL